MVAIVRSENSRSDLNNMCSYAIVSAPGKVLITGGYLILEPTYSGLVIATDSRFYTIVRAIGNENNGSVVRVKSPQFLDGLWEFNVVLKDFGRISLESRYLKLFCFSVIEPCC